ncbi:universal stress protein [Croceitalea sp. MTPC9]|uniref:universal stress protein n=1 Tax=unclassified Croceitalea TaxID=2632280 RepID=UPI002B3FF33F|nr:universal stress protein [Croceitalea sp. MTPC6]GMN17985.1 universal stress protein [Croceitalea sp. MTPC9]
MKNILVPVDFSETSAYALEIAAQIAKRFNAKLIVLHMMGVSDAVLTKDESQEEQEAQYYIRLAKERFDSFLNWPYLKELKVQTIIQNQKDFYEINAVAKEQQIDLIVMGSHGTSGLHEFFVGSNTEKVVRTSEVPVLVVKEQDSNFSIDTMAFVSDFELESIPVFKKAIEFATQFSAKFLPAYINLSGFDLKTEKEIENQVALFMNNANTLFDVKIYYASSLEEGIMNYRKKINADIIAIGTHGTKGLAHFFKGSTAENIANHANLPVLTFKIG